MLEQLFNKYAAYDNAVGTDKNTSHSYTNLYTELLSPLKDSEISLLEVGVYGGYSIQVWLEYFEKASITAVDIDWSTCAFSDWPSRVKTIDGDATLPETFKDVGIVDVIIDDGSHLTEHQIETFNILYPKLATGGIYIIEDVTDPYSLEQAIKALTDKYIIHDLRHLKNRFDDIVIVIFK